MDNCGIFNLYSIIFFERIYCNKQKNLNNTHIFQTSEHLRQGNELIKYVKISQIIFI